MLRLIQTEFIKNYSLKKLLLIPIVLMIAAIVLIKFEDDYGHYKVYVGNEYTKSDYQSLEGQLEENYEKNPNVFNEDLIKIKNEIEDNFKLAQKIINNSQEEMWQKKLMVIYIREVSHKYALLRLEDCNRDDITKYILGYENPGTTDHYHNIKEAYMDYLDLYKNTDYQKKKMETEEKIKKLEQILKNDNYYEYMEYYCQHNDFSNYNNRYKEYCNYIIENKIKRETDYRVVNVSQYLYYNDMKNPDFILNRKDDEYNNRLRENMKEIYQKQEKILTYAYKHEMKHDIKFPDRGEYLPYYGYYINTKNYMNKGLSLGFIVFFILIITNSGIVSKEHDKGTVKLLLTAPVKREKILLSKFIYLIINMYLLWILGLFFIFIFSGLQYGFSDLFVNELVLLNDKVYEINYIIWYIVELFIHSIPVIFFISFMFFLSSTLKNTTFTSSICSILTILSMIMWVFLDSLKIKALYYILYTPFPYLNFNFIRENSKYYMNCISNTSLKSTYGIIISIICTTILLTVSIKHYKTIDIGNR